MTPTQKNIILTVSIIAISIAFSLVVQMLYYAYANVSLAKDFTHCTAETCQKTILTFFITSIIIAILILSLSVLKLKSAKGILDGLVVILILALAISIFTIKNNMENDDAKLLAITNQMTELNTAINQIASEDTKEFNSSFQEGNSFLTTTYNDDKITKTFKTSKYFKIHEGSIPKEIQVTKTQEDQEYYLEITLDYSGKYNIMKDPNKEETGCINIKNVETLVGTKPTLMITNIEC